MYRGEREGMGWLRNLRVRLKMLVLNVVVGVFLAIVGISGYTHMNDLNKQTEAMYAESLQPVEWLDEARAHSRGIEALTAQLMLEKDAKRQQDMVEEIKARIDKSDQVLKQITALSLDGYEKERITKIQSILPTYRVERQKAIDLALAGKQAEAYTYFVSHALTPLNEFNSLLQELTDYKIKQADEMSKQGRQNANEANLIMISTFVIAMIVCAALCSIISGMISKPLGRMQELMERAETGDMTVRGDYEASDELGRLNHTFNNMMNGLCTVIKQVNDNAAGLANSSRQLAVNAEGANHATHEIAAAIQKVAAGSETMMGGAEESARSMEEMAIGIQRIAENSSIVSESSDVMAQQAQQGNEMIRKAGHQMQLINSSVGNLSAVITQLNTRSQEIGHIVEVITDIASQTNLLALNAAIEAARAGEHGKGFAVVADEVRKLAEQSEQSAGKITALIQEIQSDTIRSVEAMEKGTKDVEAGMDIVEHAGTTFESIVNAAKQVAEQIQEVSAATEQLSAGSEQVTASVTDMSCIAKDSAADTSRVASATQEQLAVIEQIHDSVESLSTMAKELDGAVRKFTI